MVNGREIHFSSILYLAVAPGFIVYRHLYAYKTLANFTHSFSYPLLHSLSFFFFYTHTHTRPHNAHQNQALLYAVFICSCVKLTPILTLKPHIFVHYNIHTTVCTYFHGSKWQGWNENKKNNTNTSKYYFIETASYATWKIIP